MVNLDQYFQIREAYHLNKWSVRRISREFGVSPNTAKKYIVDDELPQYRREIVKISPVLGRFIDIIDNIIEKDLDKKSSERFTTHTLFKYFRENYQYTGSENTLRKYYCRGLGTN